MGLNLQYVAYESDNHGASICRNVREEQKRMNAPIGGRNLAVLCFSGSWFSGEEVIIGSSFPEERKHSETKTVEGLTSVLTDNTKFAIVHWLYTERAPCGTGPGMANCTSFLESFFSKHADYQSLGGGYARVNGGLEAPVFYTYQYPSSGASEVNAVLGDWASAGIVDEPGCITLKEYIRQLGKEDRGAVTATLKNFDKKF